MIKLRSGKRDVLVPQSFSELTYRELYGIKSKANEGSLLDEFTIMQVLTGFTLEALEKSVSVWYNAIDFDNILSGVTELLNSTKHNKSSVKVLGEKVKPKSFASCTFSQRIFLKNVLNQMRGNDDAVFELLPKALAICVAPQVSKDNWASEIDLIKADLWECNAKAVYENGAFFLQSSMITRGNGKLYPFRLMMYGITLVKDYLASRIRSGLHATN